MKYQLEPIGLSGQTYAPIPQLISASPNIYKPNQIQSTDGCMASFGHSSPVPVKQKLIINRNDRKLVERGLQPKAECMKVLGQQYGIKH